MSQLPIARVLAQIDFGSAFAEALGSVFHFLPRLFGALLIGVVGLLAALQIANISDGLMHRAGFNTAVHRGRVGVALERTGRDASRTVARVVFYLVLLVVAQLTFSVFGVNPVSEQIQEVIAFLPRIGAALLVVVVAAVIAAAVREVVSAALSGLGYGRLLANVVAGLLATVGLFAALNQLRIAPVIVNGLFYALVAIVVGSAIVAVGGSAVAPLQRYWQRSLPRVETESNRVRRELAEDDAVPPDGAAAEAGRGGSPS